MVSEKNQIYPWIIFSILVVTTILFLNYIKVKQKVIYWSNISISIPTMRKRVRTKNNNDPIFKGKNFKLSISSSFNNINNDKYYYTLEIPTNNSYLAWIENKNLKTVARLIETDKKELKLTKNDIEELKNGNLYFHVFYKEIEMKEIITNNYF